MNNAKSARRELLLAAVWLMIGPTVAAAIWLASVYIHL